MSDFERGDLYRIGFIPCTKYGVCVFAALQVLKLRVTFQRLHTHKITVSCIYVQRRVYEVPYSDT